MSLIVICELEQVRYVTEGVAGATNRGTVCAPRDSSSSPPIKTRPSKDVERVMRKSGLEKGKSCDMGAAKYD